MRIIIESESNCEHTKFDETANIGKDGVCNVKGNKILNSIYHLSFILTFKILSQFRIDETILFESLYTVHSVFPEILYNFKYRNLFVLFEKAYGFDDSA